MSFGLVTELIILIIQNKIEFNHNVGSLIDGATSSFLCLHFVFARSQATKPDGDDAEVQGVNVSRE